jgi:hypothetical protein
MYEAQDLEEKEVLKRALRYLLIIDSMEVSNSDWYFNDFRGHDDWVKGLTSTIVRMKKMIAEGNKNE